MPPTWWVVNATWAIVMRRFFATPCELSARIHVQVLSLGGEFLNNAEGLLRDGLHTSEIADGYQKAALKVRFCFCC